MSLIILNKPPVNNYFSLNFYQRFFKIIIKRILGQTRGPAMVTASLIAGLKELKKDFLFNPAIDQIGSGDTVYVNESVEALIWAIKMKAAGKIDKLVAGPAITVLPEEKNGIMMNDNIDIILMSAPWVKNYWINLAPALEDKIVVWPAGVRDVGVKNIKKEKVLVYQKNGDPDLVAQVMDFLEAGKIAYQVIKYGHYHHDEYLEALDSAKLMIYFSPSESQGLALCEAWMKNVPTFVWNRGYWEYGQHQWVDNSIAAPYLVVASGDYFKDFVDFKNKWPEFIGKLDSFKPREYALQNFTNQIIAKKFWDIINQPR